MGPNWYERASEELEKDMEEGKIDYPTFLAQMKELNRELREAAADEAERARDDYMGW